jgi:hypothetical protein
MTLPPNQRIRKVMYLITTAITANKIIAAVVVLAVIGVAGFFYMRSRRPTQP